MYYLLFTTTTCPKCPKFKMFVADKIQFKGEVLNEKSDGFADLASQYQISSAPTIIVFEDETKNKELFRSNDEGELEWFLKGK